MKPTQDWTPEQREAVARLEQLRYDHDEKEARAHNPYVPAMAGEKEMT